MATTDSYIYIYNTLRLSDDHAISLFAQRPDKKRYSLVDGFSLYNIHSRDIIIYRKAKTKIFKRRYRMSLLPALIN